MTPGQHQGRPYQLHVPAGSPSGLLVMLHGCDQDPEDFARGTQMNALAPDMLILYPQQTRKSNARCCWNWFYRDNQERGRGEPALLADLIERTRVEYGLGSGRAFLAGISAGGCMAAILAESYPEMFAAAALHSALAPGSATTLIGALAAMKGFHRKHLAAPTATIPTLIFQGDQDRLVHPRNAERMVARLTQGTPISEMVEGQVPQGRAFTRTCYGEKFESWLVHGMGHAWSGGSREGSYTDPQGPDASREILRFFAAHA
jgi:poly(hydroxyalkanoate) depolymerase family esterase